jgi:hypothetical protein
MPKNIEKNDVSPADECSENEHDEKESDDIISKKATIDSSDDDEVKNEPLPKQKDKKTDKKSKKDKKPDKPADSSEKKKKEEKADKEKPEKPEKADKKKPEKVDKEKPEKVDKKKPEKVDKEKPAPKKRPMSGYNIFVKSNANNCTEKVNEIATEKNIAKMKVSSNMWSTMEKSEKQIYNDLASKLAAAIASDDADAVETIYDEIKKLTTSQFDELKERVEANEE